jgi:dihydrofolate synthase/folylpolyglutamate synthase
MSAVTSDRILSRMMALHPKIIDLTLDRVWRLLDALGNPQDRLPPVIHIAGTNGKGSTLAMIRAGIEAAGQTCHAYTSPHLARFHERIRLAGALISEDHLTAVLDECEAANGGVPITYFEITTCAAILAMARARADYTLLEVGLGGRLDATNVIARPALTVITPVSMDHEGYLGDTLAGIAGEKAGIIKRLVPCVVGPQDAAALEVIEARAARLGAPLRALGLGEAAAEGAVTRAEWPARMQRLARGPLVDAAGEAELWLDGGHNPAAGQALARHLASLAPRPTWLVCGMLNTKDVGGYLAPLAAVVTGLAAVSIPGEATLPAEATSEAARGVGMKAGVAGSTLVAIREIVAHTPRARILICGSLYLAGGILRENG